jgi:hypothetical protein
MYRSGHHVGSVGKVGGVSSMPVFRFLVVRPAGHRHGPAAAPEGSGVSPLRNRRMWQEDRAAAVEAGWRTSPESSSALPRSRASRRSDCPGGCPIRADRAAGQHPQRRSLPRGDAFWLMAGRLFFCCSRPGRRRRCTGSTRPSGGRASQPPSARMSEVAACCRRSAGSTGMAGLRPGSRPGFRG